MAVEYTTKVQIFEKGGLEPLIRLLGSPDPDVQKNSVECIYLLVQVKFFVVILNYRGREALLPPPHPSYFLWV